MEYFEYISYPVGYNLLEPTTEGKKLLNKLEEIVGAESGKMPLAAGDAMTQEDWLKEILKLGGINEYTLIKIAKINPSIMILNLQFPINKEEKFNTGSTYYLDQVLHMILNLKA